MRLKYVISAVVTLLILLILSKPGFRAKLGERIYKKAATKQIAYDVIADIADGLHIALCGTGSPMPDTSRMGPCTAVIAGKRMFVVDIGAGASRNFSSLGLSSARTEAVLLTHFHSDHIGGLNDFLIQRWANTGANSPLPVYGPKGVETVMTALNTAYRFDQAYRVKHHGDVMPASGFGGTAIQFDLEATNTAIIIDDQGLKITAFGVDHGDIAAAVGYRFDYKGRSVVISGDTSRSKNLERIAKGADILVHEALNEEMIDIMSDAFTANNNPRLSTIFQDVKDIHTTPVQAAKSANSANVKMLVFSHIVPPVPSKILNTFFLDGTGAEFAGEIVMGQDGMMFSLPANSTKIIRKNLR
ncbi:MAG: MBL fold metallo-hydrolase [Robiginitomaculum sp.]|nr:MBL fold metallo-hydrolase [Robiginitomaculum sp.]